MASFKSASNGEISTQELPRESSRTSFQLRLSRQGTKRKRRHFKGDGKQVSIILTSQSGIPSPTQLASRGNLEDLKDFIEISEMFIGDRDENGATLLHHASSNNQIAVMQHLIDSGIDLNAVDNDGNTALHLAVSKGHIEAARLLLEAGASDIILNKAFDAPLHIIVRNNSTELLTIFLEYPVDILIKGYRQRIPLHVAAEKDNLEVCEILHNSIITIERYQQSFAFRLSAADQDDLTPIHLAARSGSHKVLNFMIVKGLEHGYSPEQILRFLDEENSTPLHAAVDGGHIQVVEVLLRYKAHPDESRGKQLPPFLLASAQGKLEMMKLMVQYCGKEIVHCRDLYGQTALHRCAHAINSVEMIRFLIENGAEVDAIDDQERVPLIAAIKSGSLGGVKILIKNGADIFVKDRNGLNPLHYAVKYKRKFILSSLLAMPNSSELVIDCDKKGNSPLHVALNLSQNNFVRIMVASASHQLKNVKDKDGNNYLHLAAESGDRKALSILLDIPDCQKLLNQTNKLGDTPLHLAAGGGHVRALEILLSNGAMVHKCYWGNTPFMYACYKGKAEVAKLLFEAHPFQLTWTNDEGENALHLGAESGCPEVITILLDIGMPVIMNNKQLTFFDVIISKHFVNCAIAAVKHKRWQECLDIHSPDKDHLMISLVQFMPEVAKAVLDHSHTKSDLQCEDPAYWETFDFKYLRIDSQDFEKADNIVHPVRSSHDEGIFDTPVFRYKGQRRKSSIHQFLQMSTVNNYLDVLQNMVQYNRVPLLTHPVTECYLKIKWNRYGRWVQLAKTLLIALQIIFLLVFTFSAPTPSEIRRIESMNITGNCTGNCTMETVSFSATATTTRFLALFLALVQFVDWLVAVVRLGLAESLNIIQNSFVLIDGVSILMTIIFATPWTSINFVIWEAGAIAFFFSWFSLFLTIQLFDLFGVYITMFMAITRNVLQVMVVCLVFIIAFGLSLYMLVGNTEEYNDVGHSLFKVFGLMFGDFSYDFFVQAQNNGLLFYSELTFAFLTVMTIILAIVFQNLLIGLALGHIEEIKLNAIAEKRAIEIGFYKRIDSHFIRKHFFWKLDNESRTVTTHPNKRMLWIQQLSHRFWRGLKNNDHSIIVENEASLSSDNIQSVKRELVEINDRIEELSVAQEKMAETQEKLLDTINQILSAQQPQKVE